MRRQILQNTRGLVAAARQESSSTTSRIPFVCATCRQTPQHATRTSPAAKQRFYTSTSTHHQQNSSSEQTSRRETITPQTHYDFFPETFPKGPPPNSPFTPDLKALRREFLQLQAKTHPDHAPPHQKQHAEAVSMRVNEAYKALQDPLKRAQYLLSQRGIDVEDESAKLSENALLMEVMEAREAVEEVESEEELAGIREENRGRIEGSVGVLERAFEVGDVELAAQEAVKLRYWMNIEESILGWEKGKGGGVLHH